ncbi:hypothetical protein F2Q68_00042180 [Brassica cretica]|uniref:Uncharacterized protein n=1 Tax=Brassica cretica TaxID=69181 RepID=A0A8S9MRE9_BRACR|nr:hypothetical protein F2Q68_00042180 [Brassica cretica]
MAQGGGVARVIVDSRFCVPDPVDLAMVIILTSSTTMTLHERWKVYRGASTEECDFLYTMKKSKVGIASQLLCWTGQFLGHGVFEKRAPALLDNLLQAFLMAPFFVLLEVLQSVFGYEPYPGFQARVNAKVESDIKEWRAKKQVKKNKLT